MKHALNPGTATRRTNRRLYRREQEYAIAANKAVDMMKRSGGKLAQINTQHGPRFYLIPGGPVAEGIARRIIAHRDVIAGGDGLFAGHDQTWRIER